MSDLVAYVSYMFFGARIYFFKLELRDSFMNMCTAIGC